MRERVENAIMLAIVALAVVYLARAAGCVFSVSGGFANYPSVMGPR